jgi:uncharacterized membrane protein
VKREEHDRDVNRRKEAGVDYAVSVDVDAGVETVWAVLIDVERWPEWTSSVRRVQRLDGGEFGKGGRVRIKQPGLPPAVWQVTEFEPGRLFTWSSRSPGVTTVGRHELIGTEHEAVTVRCSLEQSGPAAAVVGLLMATKARRFVDAEAQGLRARCEGAGS